MTAVGFIFLLFSGIAFVFKSVFFWWVAVLRLTTEGRVASGKLIDECKERLMKIDEDAMSAVEEPTARVLEELLDGVSDVEPAPDAALDLSMCNNQDAF